MTLASERAKNPPPHFRLALQPNPRIPFSSPMGEDVLSPTSPNLSPNPIRSRRKNTLDESGLENSQSWNRKFLVQKSPKRDSSRKQDRDQNKPRWPGLNVVTNFSKPPVLAQRAAEADARQRTRREESRAPVNQRGFVTLSDIKAPVDRKANGDYKTQERNQSSRGHTTRSDGELKFRAESNPKKKRDPAAGLGLQPFENPPGDISHSFEEGKSGVDSLKPSPIKLTELSPSDRPIMIGISIPSAKLAEHSISPDVGTAGSTTRLDGTDPDPSMTPTIIVTPAKVSSLCSIESYEPNAVALDRRRANSSIYSQAFQLGQGVTQTTDIPPVPSHSFLPSKYTPPTNPFENDNEKGSTSRAVSVCTVFDDDEIQGRPDSVESRLRMLKRSSTDTMATRHRSQGWWNHIISPFVTRGNTLFRAGSPEVGTPVPALPTPIHRGMSLREQYRKNSDRSSPSSTSKVEDVGKGDISVWTDFSRLESTRQMIRLAIDHTPGATTLVLDHPRDAAEPSVSNAPVPFEGFGAAAEYYHAYWHDQNSPTPYFECQNHSCPSLRSDQPIAIESLTEEISEESPQGPDSGRGLPEIQRPDQTPIKLFQQAPANRFSAAFSQATTSRPRRKALSEVTDIEDSDVTPVVQEAYVAPIVRAGAPILAAQSSPPDPPIPPVAVPAAPAALVPADSAAVNIAGPGVGPGAGAIPGAGPTDPAGASALAPVSVFVSLSSSATGRTPARPPAPSTVHVLVPPAARRIPAFEPTPTATTAPRRRTSGQETKLPRERDVVLPPSPVSRQPPTYFPPQSRKPPKRSAAVSPPNGSVLTQEQLPAPEPGEPSVLRSGPIPRKAVNIGRSTHSDESRPAQNTYIVNHYYNTSNTRERHEELTLADFDLPQRGSHTIDASREKREKRKKGDYRYDKQKKRKGLRFRTCFRKEPISKRKKSLLIGVTVSLIVLIILILALVMTLTRKAGDKMPVQTQWLNITGFPPVPTGISTIIQPEAVESSNCVQPDTLWSCALPKEEQSSIAPNDPDQPNFRVEIRFLNGTSANGTFVKSSKRSRIPVNAVSAGQFIRHRFLMVRDSITSSPFTPSPSPPSQEDRAFLGNTTDHNTIPFDGETTPFFMSFLSASKLPSSRRLVRRASGNSSDPFPDLTKIIPPPDVNPDGTAASANLVPFPSAQPLRLYNRGLSTEHYGFYTYYDRSIFLKSTALLNESGPSTGDVPDDQNGGATEAAASVRCTWAQTRFLVQIWTNQASTATLLGNSSHSATKKVPSSQTQNVTKSSANDFSRPGSFPYPVTITLDRHGGDISKKLIYCYGIDTRDHIVQDQKKIQLENRGAGGVLVNPAQGPFATTKVGKKDGGPGGVDGGSGGCGCQWKNFDGGV